MEADFGGENRSTRWQELSFAIVGLGLIGGSYAKALRKLGVKQIIGIERDAATLQEAKQQGLVDIGMTEPDNRLKEANVIICAIYPEAIVGFIAENVDFFNESVLLTDVAGIKNDMISRPGTFKGWHGIYFRPSDGRTPGQRLGYERCAYFSECELHHRAGKA